MNVAGTTSILLMEDEIFIAMDVEDILHGAGFDRIETVSSCRAAEEWLTANDPDLVVMDIELTDGVAGAIARSLRDRNIPFIVYTGAQRKMHPDALSFSEGVWLEKPCEPATLLTEVMRCIRQGPTSIVVDGCRESKKTR
ncbi:response regulator [Rhizobium leguminosarum]|jgi:DNA-binding response OmpR family regulator|uniref:Response regulator n=1 Tax=Rhizobium laguerreae TaxID=1076926 RepID=A0A7Y2W7H6_9HYPH|nr:MULTISPECIES: response regulator [Rhizobium]MBW8788607.1 response regulator [Rhizobium leguminosarum]MBY5357903.1 response regulator [Rhizobium leguminosarum]MBY5368360.1 response regulator [Rhizobium leguminosarum]MBY5405535.1 response regulator [Rhizobium leguminosarum]MBY5447424.1 response regulator [Rhizobium leguminosarum]